MILKSVTLADDDLLLGIEIREYGWVGEKYTINSVENWRIRCRDVRDSKFLTVDRHLGFHVEEQHIVLLPYTTPHVELYFRGVCTDADSVVGQLLQAHINFVGEWFSFERFLNSAAKRAPASFLRGGFGQLAAGPQPLIERYAAVLRQNGLKASSPPSTEPTWSKRRICGKDVIETEPARVLLLGGCYVVTPQVTAERI